LVTGRRVAIVPEAGERFGLTLKRLRSAARLTQEELAERSDISARTVSDLERGLRSAVYPHTARRLAAALGLEDDARDRFEAVAAGRTTRNPQTPTRALPIPPTPLLGREDDLLRIVSALNDPGVRLITLTGPGGIGKTRLALAVAVAMQTSFPDGVFFISLSDVHDPELVAAVIADALDVVEIGEGIPVLIERWLAGRRALIVLDTFEHLLPAALLVSSMIVRAPASKLLVTSRRRLNVRGELEIEVPPLDLSSAAALFEARAQAGEHDPELVMKICRQLDGLPLAIELAAARTKHLALPALASQLNNRLSLLTGGPVDLPLRQQAIGETVAWSHGLLSEPERVMFRRLALFSGGWTLASAEVVCDIPEALVVISGLIEQSLVRLIGQGVEARYGMLDVIHEYGAERLEEAVETESTAQRHAAYYLELAEQAEARLVGARQEEWIRRLDAERGNLRRAIAWALEQTDNAVALRFTVALWRYWRYTGEFAEGRRWSEAALAMRGAAGHASLRAKALWATAFLTYPQGDYSRMAELAPECLDMARQGGDPLDLRNALTVVGQLAMCEGRYTDAMEPLRESLDICRRLGMSWQLGTSHLNFGNALLHSGQVAEAERIYRDGLKVYMELGDATFAARITNVIAHAALAEDDVERADKLARDALTGFARQHERLGVGEALDTLAAVAAARGDSERAARLDGASKGIHETIASRPAPFERAICSRFIKVAQGALGEDRWRSSWDAGHDLTLEEAIEYALSGSAEQSLSAK
jgi:predicted ATPase/transcriptional regulator with XRE-family HTH domain